MSQADSQRWHQRRLDMGEVIGGGFIILRRGKEFGRISIDKSKLPFEHASLPRAEAEANRLAASNAGQRFDVWQLVKTVTCKMGSDS